MNNLNLDNDYNNNNIIRFNNEGKVWRWTEKKGNLIAYNWDKKIKMNVISRFSGILVLLIGTLLTIGISSFASGHSILSTLVIILGLSFTMLTSATLMIGPDYFVYKSTIIDKSISLIP